MDSRKRTFFKTLSWLIFSLAGSIGPTFLELGLIPTLGTTILLLSILYYIHERIWTFSTYGKELDVRVNVNLAVKKKARRRVVRSKGK